MWTLLGLLLGCDGLAPGERSLPGLPTPDVFAREAGPLLERRCGDVPCHGTDDRPFSIYARGRHRQAPADVFRTTSLSPDELQANRAAVRGFIDDRDMIRSTLLRKALADLPHAGGAVFAHASDPEVRALIGGLTP